MTTIPYVISEAHPDYKRPYLSQDFGICQEKDVPELFINKCADFIFGMTSGDDIESVNDIKNFFDNYYDEYYMDNYPWQANMFINGEWSCFIPSEEQLLNRINLLKQFEEEDLKRDCDRQSELSDEEELSHNRNEYFSQEDEEIFKNFFEKLSKEGNIDEEEYNNLSDDEKHKKYYGYLLSVLNENFIKNNLDLSKNFIEKFCNFIDKEIKQKTSDLEVIHSSELTEYITTLISLRANIFEYQSFIRNLN